MGPIFCNYKNEIEGSNWSPTEVVLKYWENVVYAIVRVSEELSQLDNDHEDLAIDH